MSVSEEGGKKKGLLKSLSSKFSRPSSKSSNTAATPHPGDRSSTADLASIPPRSSSQSDQGSQRSGKSSASGSRGGRSSSEVKRSTSGGSSRGGKKPPRLPDMNAAVAQMHREGVPNAQPPAPPSPHPLVARGLAADTLSNSFDSDGHKGGQKFGAAGDDGAARRRDCGAEAAGGWQMNSRDCLMPFFGGVASLLQLPDFSQAPPSRDLDTAADAAAKRKGKSKLEGGARGWQERASSTRGVGAAVGGTEVAIFCHSAKLSTELKHVVWLSKDATVEDLCIAYLMGVDDGLVVCEVPTKGFTSCFLLTSVKDADSFGPINQKAFMGKKVWDVLKDNQAQLHAYWAPNSRFWAVMCGNMNQGAALEAAKMIAEQ